MSSLFIEGYFQCWVVLFPHFLTIFWAESKIYCEFSHCRDCSLAMAIGVNSDEGEKDLKNDKDEIDCEERSHEVIFVDLFWY